MEISIYTNEDGPWDGNTRTWSLRRIFPIRFRFLDISYRNRQHPIGSDVGFVRDWRGQHRCGHLVPESSGTVFLANVRERGNEVDNASNHVYPQATLQLWDSKYAIHAYVA